MHSVVLPMIRPFLINISIGIVAMLTLGSCQRASENGDSNSGLEGPTILIGLDGFRWDYRNLVETPTLDQLAGHGVVGNLRPAFPSKTFTNHHTIATGLHPNHHGVVGNTMYDPDLNERFSMGNADAVSDGRWWGGEPIWVTTEKAGLIAATYFWPGTEAEIDGVRPSHWKPYSDDVPGIDRVDQVLTWLNVPPGQRPSFLSLYFSDVDGAGHRSGPESDETSEAIRRVDNYLRRLVDGLEAIGLYDSINIVITSDHGMAQMSSDRVVYVDDYVDLRRAGVLSLGEFVALWPDDDDVDAVFASLEGAHHALTVFRRGSIPERFHIDGHRRTPPIIGVVEAGWSASTRSWAEKRNNPFSGGGHGYDNNAPSMTGIFIARGPAFQSGKSVQTLDAVDVYNVLAASIGIEAAPNDGNLSVLAEILKPTGH